MRQETQRSNWASIDLARLQQYEILFNFIREDPM